MYKGTSDLLEKKTMNATLQNLADAVTKCKQTLGVTPDVIKSVVESELRNERDTTYLRKLQRIPSVLGVSSHVLTKFTVYTQDRSQTRQDILDAGLDLKLVDIIDGN